MENVWTERSDVSLTTDPAYFAMTAKSDIKINTSGVDSSSTANINVKDYLFKKKNSGKFVESTLAKRTNKIEACLTVLDNKVAPKGDRIVYLRILTPSGKPLAGMNKGTVTVSGETLECTSNIKIDYQNEKQNICLAYEGDERNLESGTYTIELYIDNNMVHVSNYVLK